jgi:hypothetical protein
MSEKNEEKNITQARPAVERKKYIHSLTLARPVDESGRAFTVGVIGPDGMCLEIIRHDGCWSIKCANKHHLVQGEGNALLKTAEVSK